MNGVTMPESYFIDQEIDREMDVKVGRLIDGVTVREEKVTDNFTDYICNGNAGAKDVGLPTWCILPWYSSHCEYAFDRVVSKLLGDSWRLDLTGSAEGGWTAKFTCIPGARGKFEAHAKTPARAICLAALKVVEKWPIRREE